MNIINGHSINQFWHTTNIESIDQYIRKYVSLKRSDVALHLICHSLHEANQPPSDNIKYLVKQFNEHKIKLTIFVNSYFHFWEDELKKLNCDVVYLDYFLWRVYNEVMVKKLNSVNPQWNWAANKFLFLTGKPNKPNRVRLLWKLYNNNLLDYSVWSLFVNIHNQQSTRELLPELTDKEFEQFVEQLNFNPDGIEVIQKPHMDLHYGGIPYNHELFQHTKFRVISETGTPLFRPWITEKTWITILNNHPFILAGDLGICQRLQDMGFKTFNNYLKVPDYDTIENIDERLDAIVVNVKHFLTDTLDYQAINNDIKHNYIRFIELGKQNQNIINDFFSNLGISMDKIDLYISSQDIIQLRHNTAKKEKQT